MRNCVQGIGSSPSFEGDVQRRNLPVGLPLQLDKASSRLPPDTSHLSGGRFLFFRFHGAREDYHTPRDTADKPTTRRSKIANLMALITREFLPRSGTGVELNEGDAG